MKKQESLQTQKPKLPTLQELIENDSMTPAEKDNKLSAILNQDPPEKWLKPHPIATVVKVREGKKVTEPLMYLPIEREEWLLRSIFGKFYVDIKNVQVLANSVVVTVRVNVTNPLTGEPEYQDGVGAAPIQTEKGKGAMDWNYAKSAGVQMAAPAAESYAIKDACEKWGKIFGSDINRNSDLDYSSLAKPTAEDLRAAILVRMAEQDFAWKDGELDRVNEIIDDKLKDSYHKVLSLMDERQITKPQK